MSNSNKSIQKNKGSVFKAVLIIVTILCIAGSVLLLLKFAATAQNACDENFRTAYDKTKDETYSKYEEKAHKANEEKYHTSNRATISVGNIKEENTLEVLSVSDSWVKISDPDQEGDKTRRWVEFNATGVYTVDMSTSEFIIDDYNKYVLVKLKTPQLNRISLDNNTKAYLYKYEKGFFELNGNYDSGVKMMLNDRAEALDKLTEQLENNDGNLQKAENSTIMLIRTLIKNVNPEMDLKDENIIIQFV